MKKVIIAGATGMVGNIVLREALNSAEIREVISIVRRNSGTQHAKLREIVHKDFTDYTNLETDFNGVDVAFFCIGAYTGTVPDDKFKMITVDFSNAFADAVKQGNANATFCLLSGAGADQTEKSRISFARYKGMAENYLKTKNFGQLSIFRPGYIYPVEPRQEPNLMYRISRKLYPLLKNVMRNTSITSEQLGKAIFKGGMNGTSKVVLENIDIKMV